MTIVVFERVERQWLRRCLSRRIVHRSIMEKECILEEYDRPWKLCAGSPTSLCVKMIPMQTAICARLIFPHDLKKKRRNIYCYSYTGISFFLSFLDLPGFITPNPNTSVSSVWILLHLALFFVSFFSPPQKKEGTFLWVTLFPVLCATFTIEKISFLW